MAGSSGSGHLPEPPDPKSSARPHAIHLSLTPRASLLMSVATGGFAVLVAVLGWPSSAWVLLVAVLFGVEVGLLQTRALRHDPAPFLSANTALDVREALASTPAGKLAIRLQWSALLMIALAWLASGFRPLLAPLMGYAAFMCSRDLMSLPGLFELERLWRSSSCV